ncbi:MAG: hypothetical protein FWE91_12170 [Defluviitaleaceae bacterium]|nr:hypothetical protein [Defluviitaleaceae bacterium]MCL2836507.1 hypothetical protein [Defluviitaleaceae bacterium]
MKKILIICAAALIMLSLTACRRNPEPEPVVKAEQGWSGDFNELEAVTSAYRGTLKDGGGNEAGTAYFAMMEDGDMAIAFAGGAATVGAVGPLEIYPDGTFAYIIDKESGEGVRFVIMPSDDEEEDVYYLDFIEIGVSGFVFSVD